MKIKNSPLYQIHPYNELEKKLYDELFEYLEWSTDKDHRLLKDSFLPVLFNNKIVLQYRKYTKNEFNSDKHVLFRPLRVAKHADIIFQYIYDDESDIVSEINIYKEENKDKNLPDHFYGKIIGTDGSILCETRYKYISEIECKFALLFSYLIGREPRKEIIEVYNKQIEMERSYKKKKAKVTKENEK